MHSLQGLLPEFAESIASGKVEIYNEFSLQHEIGVFLRARLPEFVLRFERNGGFVNRCVKGIRRLSLSARSSYAQQLHP